MGVLRRMWDRVRGVRREKQIPAAIGKIDVEEFGKLIGYKIRNPNLFRQALLHRSYLQNINQDASVSNERLEFLGDSILDFVVSEYVFNEYPTATEGDLTIARARFVNQKALVAYARQIDLWNHMLLGSSAAQSSGRGSETILADAFEALIAAIYLDGGFDEARRFVYRHIRLAIAEGAIDTTDPNFKSRLLEYSQGKGFGPPRYVVLREDGPDHDRTFTVEVFLGNNSYGVGTGKNKKDAEQSAARDAIGKIRQSLHT